MINLTLENIDSLLHRLSQNVGDEESVYFFSNIMVPGIRAKSTAEYFRPYNSWFLDIQKKWEDYKITHLNNSSTIDEYSEKIKRCESYYNLMRSLVDNYPEALEDGSVTSLPEEILVEIFKLCDYKTQYRLSCVCRRFSRISNSPELELSIQKLKIQSYPFNQATLIIDCGVAVPSSNLIGQAYVRKSGATVFNTGMWISPSFTQQIEKLYKSNRDEVPPFLRTRGGTATKIADCLDETS